MPIIVSFSWPQLAREGFDLSYTSCAWTSNFKQACHCHDAAPAAFPPTCCQNKRSLIPPQKIACKCRRFRMNNRPHGKLSVRSHQVLLSMKSKCLLLSLISILPLPGLSQASESTLSLGQPHLSCFLVSQTSHHRNTKLCSHQSPCKKFRSQ
jgi:hypothetical protein